VSRRAEEELLGYYLQELEYLHGQGSSFARAYPKIAARLDLTEEGSRDPHVERLIQAVAYLTARLHRTVDQDAPEVAEALLETLYPGFLAPLPSASVVELRHDPAQGKLRAGHLVPAGTILRTGEEERTAVRFRTGYDTRLWPLEVRDARLEAPDAYEALDGRHDVASVLRVDLESTQGDLGAVELGELRFFLDGPLHEAGALYESLVRDGAGVMIATEDGSVRDLGRPALRPVGFAEDEIVLPDPPLARPAFHLLREYFAFPRKYLFVETVAMPSTVAGTRLSLLMLLGSPPSRELTLGPESVRLGCTPVVNLFPRQSEPIRLDQRRTEYRLEPDLRREANTEIHSVREVYRVPADTVESIPIPRLYGLEHVAAQTAEGQGGARAFWFARRIPATGGKPGTDTLLRFVDLDLDPTLPAEDTVFARVLCTNRHLAEQVPVGAALRFDEGGGTITGRLLHKPTPQIDPPLGSRSLWRLVSHLNADHLPLSGVSDPAALLREVLALHAPPESAPATRQIGGIVTVDARPAVDHIGRDAWRGLVRGTEVRVTLHPPAFAGANRFLFASVLRHFLGLYAHLNTFTRLVAVNGDNPDEEYTWPPLAGAHSLL